MYRLRDYQQCASDAAVNFFLDKTDKSNGLIIAPTGSGKSILVADVARRLKGKILVFQPNKEILEQNYAKYISYGNEASIYSASCNSKEIGQVTFATIGSVKNCKELFKRTRYVIVDEAHYCNPKEGMYKEFFKVVKAKVLGLTATPYRLKTIQILKKKDEFGVPYFFPKRENRSMLEFLTKMRPCMFKKIVYQVPIKYLVDRGYLARLRYFDLPLFDTETIKKNTTGSDYDEEDVKRNFSFFNMRNYMVNIVERLKNPKSGVPRNGILVFTQFKEDAEYLSSQVEGCDVLTSDMTIRQRETILDNFKSGRTRILAQVKILTCGFDYPALDTVVLARPTMSLAFYYQAIGRIIRPFEGKEGWVVDLCGSIPKFGKVEDLFYYHPDGDEMICGIVNGKNKRLTNRFL